ncbi:TetR/AcrR family transcriptional regulator [Cellulomonas cellasea]|uniref:TetR/AcrR family transcriptional regulator n=1 Tax=Cellulomonas cellasea TaxID=43670 RepID=UPI0025A36D58|nr:TetR/AcrR family transcriptional regulator [Cellulomonas cellasea]MDM8084897.1 TetR/AcrR family transcriptional regulator [Cellulomonas cellasea]
MARTGGSGATRTVMDPDDRREAIIAAARELFAEQGVGRTSIADVAARAGITRGLVYHYLTDKDTLVEVVLERHIDEFVEDVRRWDAQREVGNIDKALTDCVALFRRHLGPVAQPGALPRIEDTRLYSRFVDRAVRALVDCLQHTTVAAYAQRHRIQIDHVPETFYVLIHGLIGLASSEHKVSDRVLMDIIRQTLHLDPNDGALSSEGLPSEALPSEQSAPRQQPDAHSPLHPEGE